MPIYSYPSWDSAIFKEWRRWNDECNRKWSLEASEARKSIERIASALYDHQGGSVVGHMIIQNDLHEMEQEDENGSEKEGGQVSPVQKNVHNGNARAL